MLVLDSGGLSRLAERSPAAAALTRALRRAGFWPPHLPSMVLVECLTGRQRDDALVNRFLATCDIAQSVSERLARRAAQLRARTRRGSTVDALVVASAEPGGLVLTQDSGDIGALAALAQGVAVLPAR